jgi:uncharacterized protein (TIGR02145 family)
MKKIDYKTTNFLVAVLLLIFALSIILPSCKKDKSKLLKEEFDTPFTDEELYMLDSASVVFDDYLDSLKNKDGISYRTLFSDPNWMNKVDSILASQRIDNISVSEEILSDLDLMSTYGATLVHHNTLAEWKLPADVPDGPEQRAYAYLMVATHKRDLQIRYYPEEGNEIYTKKRIAGTDCSGFIYFLLDGVGFPNCNFTTENFKTMIPASIKQKYNQNAELLNLGKLEATKLKRGDLMLWNSHIAIVDLAGSNPLVFNSNGQPYPKDVKRNNGKILTAEDNNKSNYEFEGGNQDILQGKVRRGICAKDFKTMTSADYFKTNYEIYRIVPIIDKGKIISDNPQQGTENQELPKPLELKVLDKTGGGIAGLKVVFNVKSGGGQITSQTEVETNADGVAQATWKLGTQSAGPQEVEVKIKNFKGDYISQTTPLIFTATIGGGCNGITSVTDADGNEYQVVQIGNQCWTKENLKTTKFADGSVIPNVTSDDAWINLSSPAWCNYENNASNGNTYGKLYNWYTVADPRNVCPAGWHVPSDAEWTVLTDYLGGNAVAGVKMKTTSGWNDYNGQSGNGTNESGFSGLPGGTRYDDFGTFDSVGSYGYWWSSTEDATSSAWARYLYYSVGNAYRNYNYKHYGFSVRCLRD